MAEYTNSMSRRGALKAAGVAAGAAAFASPVVLGVFSTQASAAGCDPSIDSDAVDLLNGTPETWNTNCGSSAGVYGNYNAQTNTYSEPLPGGAGNATLQFGNGGVDNFQVECSYFTLAAPTGWVCSAKFMNGDANSIDGCVPNGWDGPHDSVPDDCIDSTFTVPVNAMSVPYCKDLAKNNSDCPSGQKLYLTAWSCCPPA